LHWRANGKASRHFGICGVLGLSLKPRRFEKILREAFTN
jgi:hypothetical protein